MSLRKAPNVLARDVPAYTSLPAPDSSWQPSHRRRCSGWKGSYSSAWRMGGGGQPPQRSKQGSTALFRHTCYAGEEGRPFFLKTKKKNTKNITGPFPFSAGLSQPHLPPPPSPSVTVRGGCHAAGPAEGAEGPAGRGGGGAEAGGPGQAGGNRIKGRGKFAGGWAGVWFPPLHYPSQRASAEKYLWCFLVPLFWKWYGVSNITASLWLCYIRCM